MTAKTTKIITQEIGFCIGIERSYKLINEMAQQSDHVFVANECSTPHENMDLDVLQRIKDKDKNLLEIYPGLKKVSIVRNFENLNKGDRLLLGYHGLPDHKKNELLERGIQMEDFRCPYLVRFDRTVESILRKDFDIIMVGKKKNHHCLHAKKLADQYQKRCSFIENSVDAESLLVGYEGKPALVSQVTGNTIFYAEVVKKLKRTGRNIRRVKTFCCDAYLRQNIALNLSKEAEVIILLNDGGGVSASLLDICSSSGKKLYPVRWKKDGTWKEDVRREWFDEVGVVAILGGILIPQWELDAAAYYIREISQ